MAEVIATKLISTKSLKLYGGSYNVSFPKLIYGKTGQKLLYICDALTIQDVKAGVVLNSDMGSTINRAFDLACEYNGSPPRSIILTTTHLARAHKSLNDRQQGRNNRKIAKLLVNLIKQHKPDTVIFAGPRLVENWIKQKHLCFLNKFSLLNKPKHYEKINVYRGYLLPVSIAGYKCNIIQTFSPRNIASSDPKHFANTVQLLGMATRDFEIAIRGYNLYSLTGLKPKLKHIANIEDFDKFYEQLIQAKTPAIDTETKNLNRIYDNKLLVILFCLDGETCYQLPMFHRETLFTGKELAYIIAKLKHYFEYATTVTHIYQNAKFDLHQLFSILNLRYYNHKIYDLMIGAYNLEENRKFVRSAGVDSGYTLDAVSAEYGGTDYLTTAIGKADRANMEKYNLNEILEYGALDVLYPYHIARFHIKEAKRRGDAYKGFYKVVTELGSNILYVFTIMERNGLFTDKHYLASLMAPNSDINTQLNKAKYIFRDSKAVRKANKLLLKDKKVPKTQGIFGTAETPWIFDINKQNHQQKLYFDVLKLRPVQFRKDGGGKLGKVFAAEYADSIPEVKMLSNYSKLKQLKSTYIDGLLKKLGTMFADGKDWRLRSNYVLVTILTGRSGSQAPNMQNIPSHGELAKIIKRLFIAMRGNIMVKLDFKAHEVRGWGNISQDDNIANSFLQGLELINRLRIARLENPKLDQEFFKWFVEVKWDAKSTTFDDRQNHVNKLRNDKPLYKLAKILLELETKGDSHKLNYQLFYGKPAATVTKDERQGVKEVVFGTIYGKMAMALARAIFKEVRVIEGKYRNLAFGMDEESEEYEELMILKFRELKPFKGKAQKLIETLFIKFKKGGDWLKNVHKEARSEYVITSIFGAVRHLWGYLHHDEKVHGMMDRRGPNSVIQGPSSQIGFTGAKIMQDICWELKQYQIHLGFLHGNAVHDCVSGDTLIHTTKGLIRIDQLAKSDKNTDIDITVSGRFKKVKVGRWITKGVKPTRTVITDIGNKITGTYGHHLLVQDSNGKEDYKKLKDIKVGDYLYVPLRKIVSKNTLKLNLNYYEAKIRQVGRNRTMTLESQIYVYNINNNIKKPKIMTPELAFCLAIIISEGSIRPRSVQIPNSDKKLLEKFSKYMNKVFGIPGNIRSVGKPGSSIKDQYVAEFNSVLLSQWLKKMGLYCGGYLDNKSPSYHKVIPWVILQADEQSQLAFFAGYIEGDGVLSNEAGIGSMSETLLHQMQAMFLSHGYFARKRGKRIVLDNLNSVKLAKDCEKYFVSREYISKHEATVNRYKGTDKYALVKVISNEKDIDQPVYDLTVTKGEPAYVANGIISHNSLENETKIKSLPLTLYYLEHAMTTQVHKKMREVFDFIPLVDLEVDIEIGGSLAALEKWDYSSASLYAGVEKSIDWMNKELNYGLNKDALISAVKYNQALIEPFRLQELQEKLKNGGVSETMLLTPKKASKLGFKL